MISEGEGWTYHQTHFLTLPSTFPGRQSYLVARASCSAVRHTIVLNSTRSHVGIGVVYANGEMPRVLHFDEEGVHDDSLASHHGYSWGKAFSLRRTDFNEICHKLREFSGYVSGDPWFFPCPPPSDAQPPL